MTAKLGFYHCCKDVTVDVDMFFGELLPNENIPAPVLFFFVRFCLLKAT